MATEPLRAAVLAFLRDCAGADVEGGLVSRALLAALLHGPGAGGKRADSRLHRRIPPANQQSGEHSVSS